MGGLLIVDAFIDGSLITVRGAALAMLLKEPWFYWRIEPVTASRTKDLLDTLRLDLTDRHVTDLGPGNGASLKVFAAGGAGTFFIERNPALYAYCRLRGFHGRLSDFIREPARVADIAYVRGSITATTFPDATSLMAWLDAIGGRAHVISPWLPATPPSWFSEALDERYRRVSVLGYQTPIYPATWVTPVLARP